MRIVQITVENRPKGLQYSFLARVMSRRIKKFCMCQFVDAMCRNFLLPVWLNSVFTFDC